MRHLLNYGSSPSRRAILLLVTSPPPFAISPVRNASPGVPVLGLSDSPPPPFPGLKALLGVLLIMKKSVRQKVKQSIPWCHSPDLTAPHVWFQQLRYSIGCILNSERTAKISQTAENCQANFRSVTSSGDWHDIVILQTFLQFPVHRKLVCQGKGRDRIYLLPGMLSFCVRGFFFFF